jgi:hypothetical protein
MRLRAVALAAAVVSVAGSGQGRVAGAQVLAYGLRLEAGAEHDSNPARLETISGLPNDRAIVSSPALRLVTSGDIAAMFGGGHLLTLAAGVAGKRFIQPSAQPEDLIIAEGRAGMSYRLSDQWLLGLQTGYYDVFQRAQSLNDARDFRSLTPGLRLEHLRGNASIALGAGWRFFAFKPEPAFDFMAPTAEASYRQSLRTDTSDPATPGAQWDFAAALSLEARRFEVGRCASLSSCPAPVGSQLRRDRFWAARLDASRTGALLLGAGLVLGLNDSNSYGESLWRLVGLVRAVVLLPWQLSLAARAELVGTKYPEAVPVGHNARTGMFVSVEDEGRSALRLELVRPLGSAVELGARYTFYTQTPGAGPVRFQRQVVLVYAALVGGR